MFDSMYNKLILKYLFSMAMVFVTMLFPGCTKDNEPIESDGEMNVNCDVVYPKFRTWPSPSGGEEPEFNSPSFEWPSGKKAKYDVRLSSSMDFSENLMEKNEIPFAIFNPHQKLNEGMWYWQYREIGKDWNQIDSFNITSNTKVFVTPGLKTILGNVSTEHPRVFAKKAGLHELRSRAKTYKETTAILHDADLVLNEAPPKEKSGLPTRAGQNDYENEKIAQSASKEIGWKVFASLNSLTQAYLLTGDLKYFHAAKNWMLEVSDWDPNGITHLSNFGY